MRTVDIKTALQKDLLVGSMDEKLLVCNIDGIKHEHRIHDVTDKFHKSRFKAKCGVTWPLLWRYSYLCRLLANIKMGKDVDPRWT